MTREALQFYLKKLTPDGVLAFNIGNIYLYFTPTLGLQARDAWVVMARQRSDLGAVSRDARWQPPPAKGRSKIWTDDYSSLLALMREELGLRPRRKIV